MQEAASNDVELMHQMFFGVYMTF